MRVKSAAFVACLMVSTFLAAAPAFALATWPSVRVVGSAVVTSTETGRVVVERLTADGSRSPVAEDLFPDQAAVSLECTEIPEPACLAITMDQAAKRVVLHGFDPLTGMSREIDVGSGFQIGLLGADGGLLYLAQKTDSWTLLRAPLPSTLPAVPTLLANLPHGAAAIVRSTLQDHSEQSASVAFVAAAPPWQTGQVWTARSGGAMLADAKGLAGAPLDIQSFVSGLWSPSSGATPWSFRPQETFPVSGPPARDAVLIRVQLHRFDTGPVSVMIEGETVRPQQDLLLQERPAVDRVGDVFVLVGTPDGIGVGVLCTDGSSPARIELVVPASLTGSLELQEAPGTTGVVMARGQPGGQLRFSHVELPRRTDQNIRACASLAGASERPVGLQQTSDGRQIRLIRPRAPDPDSLGGALVLSQPAVGHAGALILDLYGADALQPGLPHPSVLGEGRRHAQTAFGMAVLPGDGVLGRAFALSGASPNRGRSVEELARLARQLVIEQPELSGNITLRASSGGALIAVRAVLDHPELFSGAIVMSGKLDGQIEFAGMHLSGFYGATDWQDLDARIDAAPRWCGGAKFLLIHSDDDSRAPISGMRATADRLKARGCLVGTLTTPVGGHALDLNRMPPELAAAFGAELARRISSPLPRDLDLARRLIPE